MLIYDIAQIMQVNYKRWRDVKKVIYEIACVVFMVHVLQRENILALC